MSEVLQRKRLTREESRAQTRERLMDAAQELFVKLGIDATSIEEVAETAGYSRGAFYSNFESKDDLVCAVLERETQHAEQDLSTLFGAEMVPADRLASIRAYYLELATDVGDCMFWMAIQLYALRNPGVKPRIAELLHRHRTQIGDYVRRMFAELGAEPPAPPDLITFSLIAQAQGLCISRMVDPDSISLEQFKHALAVLFDRLVGQVQ